MYDEILGKKEFWEYSKSKGLAEGEIEAEWERLYNMFVFNVVAEALESLPDDKERELEFGLKPTDAKDVATLLVKLEKYIEDNPDRINREEVLKKALVATGEEYNKLTGSDYFTVK